MKQLLLTFALVTALAPLVHADSVPEPGLVMYGIVRNTAGGNARMTSGTLNWQIQETSGQFISRVAADVRRLNLIYDLRLPI